MTATATVPRKTLVRNLAGRLVRGATVVIGPTFDQQELRGKEMVLRSKGMVPCNKKGRCAGDHCVGKAVFVTEPDYQEKEGAGWRDGTTKVCLTHLVDEHGEPLIPFNEDVLEPADGSSENRAALSSGSRPALPPVRTAPNNLPPQAGEGVTWQALAEAAKERDTERLIVIARALKTENEILARRLINAIFST